MSLFPEMHSAHTATVIALREQFGSSPSSILDVLTELKSAEGKLSREVVREVARAYGVPAERVAGMASFYSLLSTGGTRDRTLRICDGVACWMKGADGILSRCESLASDSTEMTVTRNSCLGLCDKAPAALLGERQFGPMPVKLESLEQLLASKLPEPKRLPPERPHETRFVMRRATEFFRKLPESDGFPPADYRHILRMIEAGPSEIFALLESADLHGLGGAGYPTSRKWRQTAALSAEVKYVICNADESEPLSIKDRTLIDIDPHRLLEGMLLAGFAVGARRGIIYIRGEYEPQARKLEQAIEQARSAGWLGQPIDGSGFSFKIHVHRGAGAYICGEETALLESLEGKRGEPRPRPPYPVELGLSGAPTIVNNVETLAMTAAICEYGIDEFRAIHTEHAVGTKLYGLFGHVQHPGLFEAPRGLKLGELLERYGGLSDAADFSFALIGGAAGTFADRSRWNHRLDFAHNETTIPMGTGAVLVCNSSVSVPAVLRQLLHFFEVESCGKCTPCRVGTSEARQLLDQLLAGQGTTADLARFEALSRTLKLSLCGLGTSVPIPIASALRHFRNQFEALI
ncbi:MAG TPA: NADH-ubiquinone oxidoreductase-F iron-sulfur binding region domain-containing protein [Planctomycetaceae bacterium]|nr:NADH-ubiquinone oxidoreductase-F iron-sulfur binding region domain-containing protein [Planctomycetaceae bacterium]